MTTDNYRTLGKEVPIGSIPTELHKLWEANEASTNASLMNLLVYTENPEDLPENSERIRELTRENACRAVLIAMDRKAPEPSIRTWITAHCHLSQGKKSVCCEQLSFLLGGKAIGRLRNTVFANLNSDLPLVFWWQGELSDLFEERLYRLFDRLIIDSADWEHPSAGFEKISQALETLRDQLIVQDLAWTRSFHFRVAFAALFDDPMADAAAKNIESVKIIARPGQRTTALQLLAWLATQAAWQIDQTDGELLFISPEGKKIRVEIEFDPQGAPLALLEITGPDLLVRVTREPGSIHLSQLLQVGPHRLESAGPADADTSTELLADQLARGGKNSLFKKVLPKFLELLELLES